MIVDVRKAGHCKLTYTETTGDYSEAITVAQQALTFVPASRAIVAAWEQRQEAV